MTLVDRVQDALRRRDASLGEDAPAIRRRHVGYRRVIAVDGALGAPAVVKLSEAFWDAIEAGAHDVWIQLPEGDSVAPEMVEELTRLRAFAHELGRHTALIVPPGPVHETLRLHPELEVHDSLASAQRASR